MATVKGGDKFEKKLEEIRAKFADSKVLRVGFLENATYPDGTYVAMVAAIQNYGAPAAGIPPRPFFSNMVAEKQDGWPRALALNLKKTEYDVAKSFARVGEGIAGQLRKSIKDTNFPPLKPATIARKGGTKTAAKPLVDSGVMLGSVDYEIK